MNLLMNIDNLKISDIKFDNSYLYICINPNTWGRVLLETGF